MGCGAKRRQLYGRVQVSRFAAGVIFRQSSSPSILDAPTAALATPGSLCSPRGAPCITRRGTHSYRGGETPMMTDWYQRCHRRPAAQRQRRTHPGSLHPRGADAQHLLQQAARRDHRAGTRDVLPPPAQRRPLVAEHHAHLLCGIRFFFVHVLQHSWHPSNPAREERDTTAGDFEPRRSPGDPQLCADAP